MSEKIFKVFESSRPEITWYQKIFLFFVPGKWVQDDLGAIYVKQIFGMTCVIKERFYDTKTNR